MTNKNVYLKKLKLDEKYIDNPRIALMLKKPGTLSKKEKEWLKNFVDLLALSDIQPTPISRTKLSKDFIRSLNKK